MFLRPRLIPILTIQDEDLVKTTNFKDPRYLGDPVNAVKIFNGKMVDELCILDITASKEGKTPNLPLLKDIAAQAFMPLSYGGGLSKMEEVKQIIAMGFEKVVFNTALFDNPSLIKDAVSYLGSSGVVASIDVRKSDERYDVYYRAGTAKSKFSLDEVLSQVQQLGVGEIVLSSIDQDGMMQGYDLTLVNEVADLIHVPLIVNSGAGNLDHIKEVIKSGAHAAAASSFFVYYGKQKTVLITHPSEQELRDLWST